MFSDKKVFSDITLIYELFLNVIMQLPVPMYWLQ